MMDPVQHSTLVSGGSLRIPIRTLALLCVLTMAASRPVRAQTFSVIHTFSGGGDGYQLMPGSPLIVAGTSTARQVNMSGNGF